MATATLSSIQGFGSALFSRSATLQAQRAADQAEANARALRQRSADAQRVATQAEAAARTLKSRADQATSDAGDARQQANNLQAAAASGSRLGQLYGRASAQATGPAAQPGQNPAVVVSDVFTGANRGSVIDTVA